MKWLVRIFLFIFVLVAVSLIGGYIYISKDLKLDTTPLVNYNPKITTKIYDRNGELISNIFGDVNREYAKFDEIPSRLVEAVVAIEDTTFFEHSGINPEAIIRALVKDIRHMKLKEGASTLTQQLVKLTLLSSEKKLKRKINEAILAMKVEKQLNKEQIMERYLNEVFYGHGYYGVKTAAKGYFHKSLDELDLKEIAILAGIPQRPSAYDPTRHYDISLSRANTVLKRMQILGWISKEEYEKYQAIRPKVYRSTLKQNRAPYIANEVVRRLKREYPDLMTGGYKIYTTIDLETQELAQKSLLDAYEAIKKRGKEYEQKSGEKVNYSKLNGAMVALDSKSGDVLAMVGGVDYGKSEFNRATQGRRQPGSSFKPFIYLIALNAGYSTQSKLTDISRSFSYKDKDEDKEWKPSNYEKNFKGLITLRDALVHSRNLATINLVNELGLSYIHDEIERMGFRDLPNDLSISLGTFTISPLEFAGYWTIFSNYGVRVEPKLIKKVVSLDGGLREFDTKEHNVTSKEQAFLMTTILEDVIKRGTGRRAKVEGLQVAGKTGTTNEYKDAWFCGYSPQITLITWFGNDNNLPMHKETGGKAAGPAFASFFKGYLQIHPETKREFEIPGDVRVVDMPNGKKEYFTDISAPPSDEKSSLEEMDEELLF